MIIILCIIGALLVIGVASIALLPSMVGALIPTALAACVAWIAYRFIKKGLRKIKDITK
jgi:membrane protein implicated in regulation of membrane protease activity